MDREGKLYQDEMTVEKYRQKLKGEKKVYGQRAGAVARNQRRDREQKLGFCALQMLDALKELQKNEKYRVIPETLRFMINEYVNFPEPGRKQFGYEVMYQVTVDTAAYTEKEIKEKCADLAERLRKETDEMYPEDEDEGSGNRD